MSVFDFILLALASLGFAVVLNRRLSRKKVSFWRLLSSIAYNGLAGGCFIDVLKRGRLFAWEFSSDANQFSNLIFAISLCMVLFHAWIGVRLK